jgi:hypothetical protein
VQILLFSAAATLYVKEHGRHVTIFSTWREERERDREGGEEGGREGGREGGEGGREGRGGGGEGFGETVDDQ